MLGAQARLFTLAVLVVTSRAQVRYPAAVTPQVGSHAYALKVAGLPCFAPFTAWVLGVLYVRKARSYNVC